MTNSIRVGKAVIVASERTIDGVLEQGWALPGRRFTLNSNIAESEAVKINNFMRKKGISEWGEKTVKVNLKRGQKSMTEMVFDTHGLRKFKPH